MKLLGGNPEIGASRGWFAAEDLDCIEGDRWLDNRGIMDLPNNGPLVGGSGVSASRVIGEKAGGFGMRLV